MARTTAAERWSVLVDEHEASGLSIRAFAAQAEVNPRTLAWWRSRLGRSKKRKQTGFVELTVAAAPTPPVEAAEVDPTVVVALDGYAAHVVVDQVTDLALLKRVLKALC